MSYGFGYDDSLPASGEFISRDDDVAAFAAGTAGTGEENAGLRRELPAKSLILGVALGFVFPLWALSSY